MINEIIIYHGSIKIIEKPNMAQGNPKNDYGKGFYCTEDIELAKEWACKTFENGYINKYLLKCNDLKILDLTTKEFNVLNWIALLLNNRTFNINDEVALKAKDFIIKKYNIDLQKYDIVIGYRADDSYFSYAQSFINNTLSVEDLEKALKLGELGNQVVLISQKAFDNIEFISYEAVDKRIYYYKFKSRDTMARENYRKNIKTNNNIFNNTYILDIMRKERK